VRTIAHASLLRHTDAAREQVAAIAEDRTADALTVVSAAADAYRKVEHHARRLTGTTAVGRSVVPLVTMDKGGCDHPMTARTGVLTVYPHAVRQLTQRRRSSPLSGEQLADHCSDQGLMPDPVRRHPLCGQQQREGFLLLA
jgi:hypothetical protein